MKNDHNEQESVLRHVTGSSTFEEKRKTARLDLPLKVEYVVMGDEGRGTRDEGRGMKDEGREKKAVTKDVSAGGCLLLAKEEIPVDSTVELKLFLGSKEEEALLLKGKIVRLHRKEKGSYEYGIAFDGMSSEARRLFSDLCFAKMYEMIGLSNWPTAREQNK